MRNTFNELIRSLDTDKKRKSELEDTSIKTLQTEIQREKRNKQTPEYPRTVGQLQKV